MNCRGRFSVQDYIPRNFYLTFGFHCDWPPVNSLKGLKYIISFTRQCNDTNGCTDYSIIESTEECNRFYNETSLPNLIGDDRVHDITDYIRNSMVIEPMVFADGTCYQHFWEVACYIILPKCDPITQQVTHPCTEMCWDFLNGCWLKYLNLLSTMDSKFTFKRSRLDYMSSFNMSQLVNCDYLPALHDNISCFYKPVTCNSPPDVTYFTRICNSTRKEVYQLHDVVQYACVNNTLKMVGNKSVSCLYSGEWSTLPTCEAVKEVKNSVMNPVHIVVPILVLLFILLVVVVFVVVVGKNHNRKAPLGVNKEKVQFDNTLSQSTDTDELLSQSKRKQDSTLSLNSLPLLERNRKYDAFVIYHFDSDNGFVVNHILPELEKIRNFKLCIHSRDITPGHSIKDNIEEAIENSNNAIIVMSQGFVDSMWCKEEFVDCYIENMKDPTFNLFVIMMQPATNLIRVTPYMKTFFTNKTYVQKNDSKLFTKLATHLDETRKP